MHLDGTLPKNAKIKTFCNDEIFEKNEFTLNESKGPVHPSVDPYLTLGFFVNGILRWR